jgi:tRNA(Ile2) C34 agmatinyltransferase TiaS
MSQYIGTVTIREGKPVCPKCSQLMQATGLKRPTREAPLFRCVKCKTEFPPAEARAILKPQRKTRSSTWILLVAVVLAILVGFVALRR